MTFTENIRHYIVDYMYSVFHKAGKVFTSKKSSNDTVDSHDLEDVCHSNHPEFHYC